MRALLIPSATLIPYEMRAKMGNIPACLFPLENITMLERICAHYEGWSARTFVVAGEEKEKIEDFVALKRIKAEIVNVSEMRDLGYSVWAGIKAILERGGADEVTINFGDTLIANQPSAGAEDVIYFSSETVSPEWTYFKQRDGEIYSIVDKGQAGNAEDSFGNVFSGVFKIAHPQEFCGDLAAALEEVSPRLDSFYRAISAYSRRRPFRCVPAEGWMDVGHADRHAQAKLIVASRAFNSIDIDADRGTLTKHSSNKEKFIDEIKWYLKLPDQLQYLSPRIYDYSLNWDEPYVTMEYYGYNTLHEMLVYGNIAERQWRKIFRQLLFVLDDMANFRYQGDEAQRMKAMEDIYIRKTVTRLESLREDERFVPFFRDGMVINGKQYPSLDEYIQKLPALLKKRLMDSAPEFCIIHGDLCFSNILVEKYYGFLRLIDPRGQFGGYDIYGDQRYEIAKLMHSMDGQYDFIIEDMFSIQVDGNRVDLELFTKKENVFTIFCDVFRERLSDIKDLRLIESLLFLSMIPLHNDFPSRQYAMLATGLQLLEEVI